MTDPKTPTAYGEDFRQVKKFEVVDPLTVPRDLRQAVRAGADLLGLLGDAEAPARGQGHHRVAARPGARSAPAPTASRSGSPARRSSSRPTTATGRGGRTSTATSTGSSPTARRCSSSSRPATSTRWGSTRCSTRARPTPSSSRRTTASTATSRTLQLPRLQPEAAALPGQAGAPGDLARDQQAGDHRHRAARARAGGHRPLQAGDLGAQPGREALPLRPGAGAGAAGRGRLGEGAGRRPRRRTASASRSR